MRPRAPRGCASAQSYEPDRQALHGQPCGRTEGRRADGDRPQHAQEALAPNHGGDRPRVVIMLDYEKLKEGCVDAHLLSAGQSISASALRQLACDADLLPAVLNGPTRPLDVGRVQRLVTGPIRAALELRDRGCALPGCNKPPSPARRTTSFRGGWAGLLPCVESGPVVPTSPQHRRTQPPRRRPGLDHRTASGRRTAGATPAYVDRARAPRIHTRFLSG